MISRGQRRPQGAPPRIVIQFGRKRGDLWDKLRTALEYPRLWVYVAHMFSPFHLCLLAIVLAISGIAAKEAEKKGYSPVLWFFAAGLTALIGLLILALLPFVNEKSNLPGPQRKLRRRIGNLIGGVISVLGFLLVLFRFYGR